MSKFKKPILVLAFVLLLIYISTYRFSNLNNSHIVNQKSWPKWLDSGKSSFAKQLETDSDNNVYLSGWSIGQIFNDENPVKYDSFIVKFNSSGTELWHKWLSSYDVGFTIDEADNIYTITLSKNTPYSYNPNDKIKYLVSKYSSNGKELWHKELDDYGNVYSWSPLITANSSDSFYIIRQDPLVGMSYDSLIIKYDKDGNELWRKPSSEPNIIKPNPSIGTNGDTLSPSYDEDGIELRHAPISQTIYEIRAGLDENLYVAGYSKIPVSNRNGDIFYNKKPFFSKFDKNGNKLWQNWLDDGQRDNWIVFEIDNSGNSYLLVDPNERMLDSYYPDWMGDIIGLIVIKYDQNGRQVWKRDIEASSYINGYSLAIDNSNNIYVSGSTETSIFGEANRGKFDTFIVKYDKDGNELWHDLLASGNTIICRWLDNCGNDTSDDVATDSNGNVYLAGKSNGPMFGKIGRSGNNIFIAKYK